MHFSKTKHSKFNESAQLSAFYLFCFGWGTSILLSVRAACIGFIFYFFLLAFGLGLTLNLKTSLFLGTHPVQSCLSVGGLSSHPDDVSRRIIPVIYG